MSLIFYGDDFTGGDPVNVVVNGGVGEGNKALGVNGGLGHVLKAKDAFVFSLGPVGEFVPWTEQDWIELRWLIWTVKTSKLAFLMMYSSTDLKFLLCLAMYWMKSKSCSVMTLAEAAPIRASATKFCIFCNE